MHPSTRIVECCGKRAACGAGEHCRFVLVVVDLRRVGGPYGLTCLAFLCERYAVEGAVVAGAVHILVEVYGISVHNGEGEGGSGGVDSTHGNALVFCAFVVLAVPDKFIGNAERVRTRRGDSLGEREYYRIPVFCIVAYGSRSNGRAGSCIDNLNRSAFRCERRTLSVGYLNGAQFEQACIVGRSGAFKYEAVRRSEHGNRAGEFGVERVVFRGREGFFGDIEREEARFGNGLCERNRHHLGIFCAYSNRDVLRDAHHSVAQGDGLRVVVGYFFLEVERDGFEGARSRCRLNGRRERALVVYGVVEGESGVVDCAHRNALVVCLAVIERVVDIAFGHGDGVSTVSRNPFRKREHNVCEVFRAEGEVCGGNGVAFLVEHVDRRVVGKTGTVCFCKRERYAFETLVERAFIFRSGSRVCIGVLCGLHVVNERSGGVVSAAIGCGECAFGHGSCVHAAFGDCSGSGNRYLSRIFCANGYGSRFAVTRAAVDGDGLRVIVSYCLREGYHYAFEAGNCCFVCGSNRTRHEACSGFNNAFESVNGSTDVGHQLSGNICHLNDLHNVTRIARVVPVSVHAGICINRKVNLVGAESNNNGVIFDVAVMVPLRR